MYVLQMRQMSVRKLSCHGPGSASSPGAEGDNISVNSGFSTFNEDAGLQETYIGFVRAQLIILSVSVLCSCNNIVV